MSTSPIEMIDERIFDGSKGVFWAWMRQEGALRGVLLRFAGVGRQHVMDAWAAEYALETELDLLSREVAAFEVVKACGCEDIALPICIKDLDTVDLLSDAARERIAKELRIDLNAVDEHVGVAATVQLVPSAMTNFAEQWGNLGLSNQERWSNASDQLRYSIYRAYFIDFILGTADRMFSGMAYNVDTDRILMTDLAVSFPHAGYSGEKYMQMRQKGWGRSSGGVSRFVDNTPPTTYDFQTIFQDLDHKYLDEAVLTAQQMSSQLTDEIVARIAISLVEFDVPVECVASLLTRIAYLAFSPGSVIKKPIEYIRNFVVPIRAGMEITDLRVVSDVEYVNNIMTSIMADDFDVLEVIMADSAEVDYLI